DRRRTESVCREAEIARLVHCCARGCKWCRSAAIGHPRSVRESAWTERTHCFGRFRARSVSFHGPERSRHARNPAIPLSTLEFWVRTPGQVGFFTPRVTVVFQTGLVPADEVFVGDIPQRGVRSVPLAIEVFDIAVDVLLAPMKLSVQTALSVG